MHEIRPGYFRKRRRHYERLHVPFIIGIDRNGPEHVVQTPQYRHHITGAPLVTKKIHSTGMFNLQLPPNFYDTRGNKLALDPTNPPQWATDNPAVLALKPSDDGMNCDVLAVGVVGSAKVQVTIDVAPGPDVDGGIGICDVEVGPGRLAPFELHVGTETEQPPPAAPQPVAPPN